MKKNLFLLFAFLCSITFFTACSDDDEDAGWKKIPTEEIKGDNATLQVNGETVSNGSVKFEVKSGEQAVVTLNNVILAYPEVAVDVTMEEQADGTYNFSGEKGMTAAPGTRATETPVIATIKLKGNVTLDGKVKVEATTTINDSKGWAGTYSLTKYTKVGVVVTGPGYVNHQYTLNGKPGSYNNIFNGIFGALLSQILQSVTLEADGSITAMYIPNPNITFKSSWGIIAPSTSVVEALVPTEGWTKSSKNLAYWFEQNDKLYVKLNITSILSSAVGSDASSLSGLISQILNGNPATIKELIKQLGFDLSSISDETFNMLLSWIKNGIPLNVTTTDGHTYMYLDKEDFDTLMKSRTTESGTTTSDIMELWTILGNSGILPQEAQAASTLIKILVNNWDNTTVFDMGLDFQAK